jgi:rRNA maturation protein Rpf1
MITTSRYASPATRQFAKSMAREAGERYVARGKKTIAQLADEARRSGDDSISVLEERGGKAALIALITVDEKGRWAWAEERLLNTTEKEK